MPPDFSSTAYHRGGNCDPVNPAPLELDKNTSRIHDNGGKVTEPPSYAQTGIRITMQSALCNR
jgi:hypothetical protein